MLFLEQVGYSDCGS